MRGLERTRRRGRRRDAREVDSVESGRVDHGLMLRGFPIAKEGADAGVTLTVLDVNSGSCVDGANDLLTALADVVVTRLRN